MSYNTCYGCRRRTSNVAPIDPIYCCKVHESGAIAEHERRRAAAISNWKRIGAVEESARQQGQIQMLRDENLTLKMEVAGLDYDLNALRSGYQDLEAELKVIKDKYIALLEKNSEK